MLNRPKLECGERLRARRERLGLTETELAARAAVLPWTLGRMVHHQGETRFGRQLIGEVMSGRNPATFPACSR